MSTITIRTRTVFLFLAMLGMIAYVNSFAVPFHFDDFHFLKENLNTKSFGSFFDWIAGSPSAILLGRPVLHFSFLVNYLLGGLDTFGYHIVNLLIHIGNAFLIYLLLHEHAEKRSEDGYSPGALLASVLFLVHPLATESVTYISGRSSGLSAFFMLLSIVCFFRGTTARFRPVYYLLGYAAFVLALSTKESAIVLPILLLSVDYFLVSNDLRALLGRIRYHALFLMTVVLLSVLYVPYSAQVSAVLQRPWLTQFLTEARVSVLYLKLLAFPVGLNIDHDIQPSSMIDMRSVLPVLVLVVLVAAAAKLRKSRPVIALSISWFLICLLPFFAVRLNDFMAERWAYAAAIGFAIALAELLMLLKDRYRTAGTVLILLLVFVGGGLTAMRNRVYASPISLWQDAAAKSPFFFRPHANLSRAYRQLGDPQKAIEAGEQSLKLAHGRVLVNTNINIAAAYADIGAFEKAEAVLETVVPDVTDEYEVYHNLGALYARRGAYAKAVDSYSRALAIRPCSPSLHYLIGACFESLGKRTEAREHYIQATTCVAQTGSEFVNQGNAYARLGQETKVMASMVEAIKADPLDINIRLLLANRLYGTGNLDLAFREYSTIAAIAPGFVRAPLSMGIIMLDKNENREAERYFIRALGLAPTGSPDRKVLEDLLRKAREQG